MRTISLQSTVAAASDAVSCDLDAEAIILSVRTGTYYGLDAVGHRVWQLLQQPRTVMALRDVVLTEFEVGAERCERELLLLLEDLEHNQLVEVRDADAA